VTEVGGKVNSDKGTGAISWHALVYSGHPVCRLLVATALFRVSQTVSLGLHFQSHAPLPSHGYVHSCVFDIRRRGSYQISPGRS
jgi:hypothetical protein